MKVRIKRLDPSVNLPAYESKEAAAMDLSSSEDVVIQPREIVRIKTGLIIEAPSGHFFAVIPRSSTPKKKGLAMPHSIGVLDPDYSGPEDELLIQVYNFTDKPVEVKKGERIAQGMILEVPHIEWEEVNEIRNESRGGFGSTS